MPKDKTNLEQERLLIEFRYRANEVLLKNGLDECYQPDFLNRFQQDIIKAMTWAQAQPALDGKQPQKRAEYLADPSLYGLSNRVRHICLLEYIENVDQLAQKPTSYYMRIPNCGIVTIREIYAFCLNRGKQMVNDLPAHYKIEG